MERNKQILQTLTTVIALSMGCYVGIDDPIETRSTPPTSTHVIFDAIGVIPEDSSYQAIPPTRIHDTRAEGGEPLSENQTITVKIAGHGGIPEHPVGAVILNVTVTDTQTAGHVAVYSDAEYPGTSNINFNPRETAAGLVIVRPDKAGSVKLRHRSTGGKSNVIVDAFGWFPSTSTVRMVQPSRIFDSRSEEHGAAVIAAGAEQDIQLAGLSSVPRSGVSAVIINLTVVDPSEPGFAAVFAAGTERPETSNLNYESHRARANLAIVPVSADGEMTLFSLSDAHYIIDVLGYVVGDDDFRSIKPVRLHDTRADRNGAVSSDSSFSVDASEITDLKGGAKAIFGNIVAVAPTGPGYLQVFADEVPPTSNVNFSAGVTTANAVMTAVAPRGTFTVRAKVADTDLPSPEIQRAIEYGFDALDSVYTGACAAKYRMGAAPERDTWHYGSSCRSGQSNYYQPAGVRGFDCSGLVFKMFEHAGVDFPWTNTKEIADNAPRVDRADIRVGDLLVRRGKHVAFYIGDHDGDGITSVIEATPKHERGDGAKTGVIISNASTYLDDDYYSIRRAPGT